jgi:hypothetical protein
VAPCRVFTEESVVPGDALIFSSARKIVAAGVDIETQVPLGRHPLDIHSVAIHIGDDAEAAAPLRDPSLQHLLTGAIPSATMEWSALRIHHALAPKLTVADNKVGRELLNFSHSVERCHADCITVMIRMRDAANTEGCKSQQT